MLKAIKSFLLLSLLGMGGCTTPTSLQDNARSLLDRAEFGEGEQGCVDIRAAIDLNPLPFLTTNASLILKKNTGEGAPEC